MDRDLRGERWIRDTLMPPNPLVSIIIPYYNLEAYIAQTAWSARRQTYPHLEIIVVDDGSPVPATSCLRDINGVRFLRTENRGCAAARNYGFSHSSGQYLIFLDGDDLLLPGAVEAHLRTLNSKPDAALSFGPVRIIDELGRQMRSPHICRPRKSYFLMLLESNPIECPGGAMIRRDAFEEAGLFDESLRNAEDYDLYLRMARCHPFVQHESCVVEYRKHGGGKSQQKEKMLRTVMTILDKLEKSNLLTKTELRRLRHGRCRWLHTFQPQNTLAYHLRGIYYSFRAMLGVSFRHYFRREG